MKVPNGPIGPMVLGKKKFKKNKSRTRTLLITFEPFHTFKIWYRYECFNDSISQNNEKINTNVPNTKQFNYIEKELV